MKRTLFLLIFILAAVCWALVVLQSTVAHGMAVYSALGVAIFGAFWIGAIGLRLYVLIGFKTPIPYKPIAIICGNDPLVPCQVGHREAYIAKY